MGIGRVDPGNMRVVAMSAVRFWSRVRWAGGLIALGVWTSWVVAQVPGSAPARALNAPSATPPANTRPVITVDNAVHDFGTNWAGTRLEHTFKITNTGNATLEIREVRPGCSCATAGAYPKSLQPGETGSFPLVLDTTSIYGQYTRTPVIASNDPATPQLMLQLKGTVKRIIEVSPPMASFGVVYGGTPQTLTLKIVNNGEAPLQLALDPFASAGPFRFELTETTPGKAFELKVTAMMPFDTPGLKRTEGRLMTNLASQRDLTVIASLVVRDRLDVQPPSVMVYPPADPAAAMTTMTRLLSFTNSGADPVKILEVSSDEPQFKVSFQPQLAGKNYLVRIEMPGNYAVPPEGRKIVIKTDDKTKPVLHVPVIKAFTPTAATRPAPVASAPVAPRSARRPAELMIGQKAPDFKLTTVSGKSASPADFSGKITVLDFVSSRCGYCKRQLPRVETLRPKYEEKGVRYLIVGETMGRNEETKEMLQAVLTQLNVKADFAMDAGNTVGRMFQATGYPTMVILGKTGMIEAVNIGNKVDLEDLMKGQLDALLDGKAIPDKFLPPKG